MRIPEFELSKFSCAQLATSQGYLLKWRIEFNNKNIWVKTSSFTTDTWGVESCAEIIVGILAEELGLKRVTKYYPCTLILDGQEVFGCYSYEFIDTHETFYSLRDMCSYDLLDEENSYYGNVGYDKLLTDLEKLGVDCKLYKEYLDTNILVDFLVLNVDRHFGNLGVIRNKTTGKFETPYVFDCGNSFMGASCNEYYRQNGLYQMAKPFTCDFSEQLMYTKFSEGTYLGKPHTTLKEIDRLVIPILGEEKAQQMKDLLLDRINLANEITLGAGVKE